MERNACCASLNVFHPVGFRAGGGRAPRLTPALGILTPKAAKIRMAGHTESELLRANIAASGRGQSIAQLATIRHRRLNWRLRGCDLLAGLPPRYSDPAGGQYIIRAVHFEVNWRNGEILASLATLRRQPTQFVWVVSDAQAGAHPNCVCSSLTHSTAVRKAVVWGTPMAFCSSDCSCPKTRVRRNSTSHSTRRLAQAELRRRK